MKTAPPRTDASLEHQRQQLRGQIERYRTFLARGVYVDVYLIERPMTTRKEQEYRQALSAAEMKLTLLEVR